MKFLEHALGPVGRHADAGVGDDDADFAAPAPAAEQHAAAAREFERVGEQIAQRQFDERAVGHDLRAGRRDAEFEPPVARRRAEAGAQRVEQLGERHRGQIRLDEARVDLRDVEQRVDHRAQGAQRTVDVAHQFGRLALPQAPRQRADEQRHRMQRLAQIVARGGEESRFGADGFDRLVARGLQLRLERALPRDVEQKQEAAENAAVGVVVGISEAAHDVDHAAGEIDRRFEFGVRPGEGALDVRARSGGELPPDVAEASVEIGGGARPGPRLDRRIDEMTNKINVVIGDNPGKAVGHDVEHLRVAQEARGALHAEAMKWRLRLVHPARFPSVIRHQTLHLRVAAANGKRPNGLCPSA